MTSSKVFRLRALLFTALICGALGWWLHGPSEFSAGQTEASAVGSTRDAEARKAAGSNGIAIPTINPAPSKDNISSAPPEDISALQRSLAETMERVFNTD